MFDLVLDMASELQIHVAAGNGFWSARCQAGAQDHERDGAGLDSAGVGSAFDHELGSRQHGQSISCDDAALLALGAPLFEQD